MAWVISKRLYENLHCLPVPVAESLAEKFMDGAQSVLLNAMHQPLQIWLHDKMTKPLKLSQFGPMSAHLMENLGEIASMLSAAVSPAKTSVPPAKVSELRVQEAGYGVNLHELLAKFDQDTSSWKTPRVSLLEDWNPSLQIWPAWGMMRTGVALGLTMSMRRTTDTVFGCLPQNKALFHHLSAPLLSAKWQTPTAVQINVRSDEAWNKKSKKRLATGRKTLPPGTLQEQVDMSDDTPCWDWNTSPKNPKKWLTPTASNTSTGENTQSFVKRNGDRSERCAQSLAAQVNDPNTWPTPTASMHKGAGKNGKMRNRLDYATERWPTPQARDHKGASKRAKNGEGDDLPNAVKKYPTPAARDYKGANGFDTTQEKLSEGKRSHLGQLPNVVQQENGAAIQGNLNPDWVEWLMGWPIGWTSRKPLMKADYLAPDWWMLDPANEENSAIPRVKTGVANRIGRLRAIGNGQVPKTAALAWYVLGGPIIESERENNAI